MSNPPAYRRIAVASTFSPRFEQVLAEAKRMGQRFGAQLSLVHVGQKSDEAAARFSEALRNLELPADSPIYYEQGHPAEAILRAVERNGIELILAGALEKELVLHPFLGNVARRLLRDTRSSVLLFTQPASEPKPLRNVVFIVTDYSAYAADALRRTLHLAALEKSERVFVVRLITTFDEARATREGEAQPDEEEMLEHFVLDLGHIDVPVEVRCVRGNTGFAAADFVKSVNADLLVIPIDATQGGGQLPANLEWLADVIPCNVWVIR